MKLLDWYWIKNKALWLNSPTDLNDEEYDTAPRALFLIAIDWFVGSERPYMTIEKPPKDYYKFFTFKIYLTYYQFCVKVRLNKMSYRTKDEYLQWRKHDA